MKILSVLLGISAITVSWISAAQAITITAIDGDWSTTGGLDVRPNDNISVAYGDGAESQVRWGGTTRFGQSGLGFTGNMPSSDIFDGDGVFAIGQLRHFNDPIGTGTSASEAFLSIYMQFGGPLGPSESFNFDFGIDETLNEPGLPTSDDSISFLTSPSRDLFKYNGITFSIELLGFGSSADNLINSFVTPEGGINSTQLWAKFTNLTRAPKRTSMPVPEPTSILLFGTGLIGLAGAKFRKKKYN